MKSIYSMTYNELEDFFTLNGYKKFKAKQVYDWLYKKRVNSFKEMYNVSKKVIELLEDNFIFDSIFLCYKIMDNCQSFGCSCGGRSICHAAI